MAKKKNALTPEQKAAYLAECESLLVFAEKLVDELKLATSALPKNPRRHLLHFSYLGTILQTRGSRLNVALDHIQSPKETEDYSQEHLARLRAIYRFVGNLRQDCLRHIPLKMQ